jgi:hypothetical protein
MTRSRARNSGNSRKQVITKSYSFDHIIVSHTNSTQSAANPIVGADKTLHPNYGMPNDTSITSSLGLGSIVGSGANSGIFTKFLIKKVVVTIRATNLDSIAKIINFLPQAFNSPTIATNYPSQLNCRQGVKSFQLAKAGETGATKILRFTVVPWIVEGYVSWEAYSANSSYQCSSTVRGSLYTRYYTQQETFDATTNCTSGIDYQATEEYHVHCLQLNGLLNA